MSNNLKLNGIVYKGITNIQLPTEDGGVATYSIVNKDRFYKANFVSATVIPTLGKIDMPILQFNSNNAKFEASFVEASISQE